jgi:hypothetical protein
MMPAGPAIKPAVPCLCRVEHMADGSGSRVFRSPDCPEHAHLLQPQEAPQPIPFGLDHAVKEGPAMVADNNRPVDTEPPPSRSFAETRDAVARETAKQGRGK